jgi:hypothetical protein
MDKLNLNAYKNSYKWGAVFPKPCNCRVCEGGVSGSSPPSRTMTTLGIARDRGQAPDEYFFPAQKMSGNE